MTDIRKDQLASWVAKQLEITSPKLEPVSNDASFRRYFRFVYQGKSLIAVDSPPETENNQAFQLVSSLLCEQGLIVPSVLKVSFELGFMILTDLGNRLYLPALNNQTADQLYSRAMEAIQTMQSIPQALLEGLPEYDSEQLHCEMELFRKWLVRRHLQLTLSEQEHRLLSDTFNKLALNALKQPQVFVHRDYHSRNLMICSETTPGLIDFQDAVVGPVSYDLVSLLKDCYIRWPEKQVRDWCHQYYQKIYQAGLTSDDFDTFFKAFELMGMQRHLKVLGIFCRLNYRDSKPAYLNDLPLTFDYLIKAVARYPEFDEFYEFLQHRIQPLLFK